MDVGSWENEPPLPTYTTLSLELGNWKLPSYRATWLDFHFALTAAFGMLVPYTRRDVSAQKKEAIYNLSPPPPFRILFWWAKEE